MNHFTPFTPKPSRQTLAFLRAFARIYEPDKLNEEEARQRAAAWADAWTDTWTDAQAGC